MLALFRLWRPGQRAADLARLVQITGAPQRRNEGQRYLGGRAQLLIAERSDRFDREPSQAREVVVDVVARNPELLQVGAHGSGRKPEIAARSDGCPGRALGELLAVLAQDQPVVDVLRRKGAESLVKTTMKRLVRPVVVAAVHVGDPEVDVVDDTRQVVRRRSVLPQKRRAIEAVGPDLLGRLAIAPLPPALADWALLPVDPEPAEVLEDRRLAPRDVAGGIRVVDPEQHPVPGAPIDDRAQGIANVKGAGGAGCETDANHRINLTLSSQPNDVLRRRQPRP